MSTTQKPPLAYEQTPDRQVNQIQTNVNSVLSNVLANPFLFGNLVQISVNAGATVRVPHGLGRMPQGFFVVDAHLNPALLTRGATDTANMDITSGNTGTYSLWVY